MGQARLPSKKRSPGYPIGRIPHRAIVTPARTRHIERLVRFAALLRLKLLIALYSG
jgi:hypothetical protein